MIVALLALFVALDGPASAAHLINGKLLKRGSVTGKAIKNRSLGMRDLSKASIRKLQTTAAGSVTESKLANGAVTPGKLAPGAVGSGAIAAGGVTGGNIADSSLTGADIADGGLGANDIGRFWGHFSVVLGRDKNQKDHPILAGECWSAEPVGLAPERAGANINQDVLVVTPGPEWPDKKLSLTVRQSSNASRFVLIACNPLRNVVGNDVPAGTQVSFNYVVIGVP
jgi:hypothetical protein